MTDVREALMTGRKSDGTAVRRPLSPHLQVYKPQITSVLSIFHRMTGVALSAGTLLLVWWLVAAATSEGAYATVSGFIRSPIGWLLLFGWSVALWFHFCNGIRHLFWDFGHGFELPQVHASGKAVLVATGVLTLLTWIVVIAF
ncbi:MAG: succinate dehydrogenase, cytochrome b556 subunit [Acetobacteraceae bacterium SCN 69-10]|nr:succinate dehydrogenase, cytochrome b556 subunit [Rhodospirillales bacterium]ODU58805.1 MAG: succinate dehydrogenase, cytochrome b556 subunit [Acetobacteraceae bacterium SCN 69-10]OJY77446.1 MAG: succinate dehydrogenase, cytochrome b556 subunit [Rhodospirillales bacterium 70-18]